jgi:hypothetical protein
MLSQQLSQQKKRAISADSRLPATRLGQLAARSRQHVHGTSNRQGPAPPARAQNGVDAASNQLRQRRETRASSRQQGG